MPRVTINASLFLFLLLITYSGSESEFGRVYNPSVYSHASDIDLNSNEPYPAWSSDKQIPMSAEEIEDIFLDLTQKFGFQRDSMRNMVLISISLSCHFTSK